MKTGVVISGVFHGSLIAVALLGLPWFAPERAEIQQTTTVDIISASEFDASQSSAPEGFVPEEVVMGPPPVEMATAERPEDDIAPEKTVQDDVEDPSEQEAAANLEQVRTRVEDPDVQVEVDDAVTDAPTFSQPTLPGADSLASAAPGRPNPNRPPAPRQAPIVSPNASPVFDSSITTSDRTQTATAEPEEPTEETPVEEQDATSEEEATTEVTPEPESGDPDTLALQRASPPRARPQDFAEEIAEKVAAAEAERLAEEEAAEAERLAQEEAEQAEAEAQAAREAEDEAERLAQEEADAEAAEIAAALAAAESETAGAPENTPVGPPLSAGERDLFFSQISECWVFDPGTQDAADLVVTIEFDLNPDGTVAGNPKLVDPSSPSDSVQLAFEAASRAIRRCSAQNGGYSLPGDKYDQWQKARITFDPSKRALNW